MSFSINAITSKLMHHVITLLYIALFSLKKKLGFRQPKHETEQHAGAFTFQVGLLITI